MSKKNNLAYLPWLIWGTAESFTLFQFLIQLTGGVIVKPLMTDFGVTALGAAVLTSSFYYIYITLQIPVGMIMDRVGPRRLLSSGAFVCGLGCILFSQTTHFYVALFARLCMGGGAAFAFVGTLYIIREWFPAHRYAFLVGLSEMLGMFWAVFGTVVFAALLYEYGWRICTLGCGIFFLINSISCALFIRDHHPNNKTNSQKGVVVRFQHRLMSVLRSTLAWHNGIYSGLMFSVVTVFIALWGTPFLELSLHISLKKAATVGSMAFIGVALGCPLYGFISQKYTKRRPFLIFSGLSSAILLGLIIYIPHLSIITVSFLMFLVGVCCSGYILCFAISDDIALAKVRSTYTGFTNAICMLTAPLFQPVVGFILDWRQPTHGHYTLVDYRYGFSVLILAPLCAALLGWFMPETFKQRKVKV